MSRRATRVVVRARGTRFVPRWCCVGRGLARRGVVEVNGRISSARVFEDTIADLALHADPGIDLVTDRVHLRVDVVPFRRAKSATPFSTVALCTFGLSTTVRRRFVLAELNVVTTPPAPIPDARFPKTNARTTAVTPERAHLQLRRVGADDDGLRITREGRRRALRVNARRGEGDPSGNQHHHRRPNEGTERTDEETTSAHDPSQMHHTCPA